MSAQDAHRPSLQFDGNDASSAPNPILSLPITEWDQATLMKRASYLAGSYAALRRQTAELSQNNGLGFEQQFDSLKTVGEDQPSKASYHTKNQHLNRYRNILAYDHSRVVLAELSTDYINANWISGYKKRHAYIASQGPVPDSLSHFWYMVWQSKADVIVMVTREVEDGTLKCHRYWPDPTSKPSTKTMSFDKIKVEFLDSSSNPIYVRRRFQVTKGKEAPRIIQHFEYEAWPDHGVPLTSREFLEFRQTIINASTNPEAPLIVHCSAGVGRTGTYLAIDRLVRMVDDSHNPLDVAAVVTDLRRCRNFMVQTFVQFAFVYRTILDYIRDALHVVAAEVKRRQPPASPPKQLDAVQEPVSDKQAPPPPPPPLPPADLAREEKKTVASASATAQPQAVMSEPAIVQSVQEADRDAREQDSQEAQEIDALTGGKKPGSIIPVQPDEITKARKLWEVNNKKQPEMYNLDCVLSTCQSRMEALRRQGYVLLLADQNVTRAVVKAAKDSKSKQMEDEAKRRQSEEAAASKQAADQKQAEENAKKAEEKASAKKKADQFLRKMSVDAAQVPK